MPQQLSAVLHQILTGQVKGAVLLGVALVLFLYFLPSLMAFNRAQKRFWIILFLNIPLTFVQSAILQKFFPGLLMIEPGNLVGMMVIGLIANFGIGWLALLVWSLMPGTPDPWLFRARETKTYDAIAALPLIFWFAYGALQLRAVLAHDGAMIAAGTASLLIWVRFFALLMAAGFNLLLIYLLMVRDKPVAKAHGAVPRIFAVLGTFAGVGILQLPVAQLGLGTQILAAVLIGLGSLGSFLVLWRLGKSFSIMPEARKLVTGGPYAYARHPLYTVEMITIAGTALQFAAPWSWALALLVVTLLWIRSHFEEQALTGAYPEYAAYR
ncbi:MAG TPA: methyltransferase, partial [Rhizomicrobium sp.]|nr:methyltransferase [Rhizomicrobium sp.]